MSAALPRLESVPAAAAPASGLRLSSSWLRAFPTWARYPTGVTVLVGLYWLSAHVGYWLGFSGPVASTVWLPAGIGIAGLYLGGLRFWPGVLIGDLLVNDYRALPVGTALVQTVGNVLECVVAVWLLHRLVRDRSPLASLESLAMGACALVAGVAISATVGVTASWAGGVIAVHDWPHIWRTWFLGDFSGALMVVPFAIAWSQLPGRWPTTRRWIEAVVWLAVLVAATEGAFRTSLHLVYLVFPSLIWSAVRFGRRGATLAVLIASGLAIWETRHLNGPFAFRSITESVVVTQLYIVIAVVSTLCLAVLVAEREQFAVRLGASRLEALTAAETERRKVERDLHDGVQQRLLALRVHLQLASEAGPIDDIPDLLGYADTEIRAAVEELRDLVHHVLPATLRELSLASALRSLGDRSPVPVTFLELPQQPLPGPIEEAAYYIVAEALANAQKHANASSIRVRIARRLQEVRIEVADDGAGGAVETSGSGLRGLRERTADLGGTFEIDSPRGGGTALTAVFPVG